MRQRAPQTRSSALSSYRAALADDDAQALERALAPIDDELRGFAYEGAAMGVALRDMLAPWRSSRLERLLVGPGRAHVYMVHVGTGWALARMRRGPRATLRLNPLLRWLALDGFGFHQGYFQPLRHIDGCARQRGFWGDAARAFDQGLGRSLWFVTAAQPERIVQAIGRFEESRQPDLWSGVALAAAYAGAGGPRTLERLAVAGAPFRSHLAQGAAFAATAREHAGNPALHTELACRTLASLSSREAAKLTDEAARPVLDLHSSKRVEMQSSMSRATNGGTTHVLLWTPGGRYREAAGAIPAEARRGWTLAIGAQDLNGDLRPELYIANDFGNDRLLVNRSTPGRVRFELVAGRQRLPTESSSVLGRLVQGDGRRLRRPQRRHPAGHSRQQHRGGVRADGEPLRVGQRERARSAGVREPKRAARARTRRVGVGRAPRRLRQRRLAGGAPGDGLRARRREPLARAAGACDR